MSIELRRRRRTGLPSLKRCSTTSVCAKNLQPDEFIDKSQQLGFFRFDSLNYASTNWRNAQMQYNGHEPKVISHFGSRVNFTSHYHYTVQELEPYRRIGDVEMDALLDDLSTTTGGVGAFDDVIGLCEEAYHRFKSSRTHAQIAITGDSSVEEMSPPANFYKHYHNIPSWVDWEQIQRGINVFLAYLPAAGASLYYRSLIGGFSIPKIVEVLIATRYLVPASMRCVAVDTDKLNKECSNDDRKRTFERLIDTGGFMACCFAPIPKRCNDDDDDNEMPAAALRPDAIGWKAALRVRVLHAKVRRSLLKSKSWEIKNGVPINQEDMAATLLAFGVNVLMGIEYVAGRPLSQEDQRDYLALWRYLGWLLGVDTPDDDSSSNPCRRERLYSIDPCGSNKYLEGTLAVKDPILHSYATLESMILHLLYPTSESRQLVHHLLSFNGRFHFRSEMCRKFLGDPLSDDLDIANSSSIVTKFTVYLFLMFLRCYTLMAMIFPRMQRVLVGWHGSFYRRFLAAWEKNHSKRVGASMDREDSRELKSCPFSMMMPPVVSS